MFAWANLQRDKTALKSAFGKALTFLINQWPHLTNYLKDGRLELPNNRAERSIKPFGPKELAVCKCAGRCTIQCCDLQLD